MVYQAGIPRSSFSGGWNKSLFMLHQNRTFHHFAVSDEQTLSQLYHRCQSARFYFGYCRSHSHALFLYLRSRRSCGGIWGGCAAAGIDAESLYGLNTRYLMKMEEQKPKKWNFYFAVPNYCSKIIARGNNDAGYVSWWKIDGLDWRDAQEGSIGCRHSFVTGLQQGRSGGFKSRTKSLPSLYVSLELSGRIAP